VQLAQGDKDGGYDGDGAFEPPYAVIGASFFSNYANA
jgi:hypothetical protein